MADEADPELARRQFKAVRTALLCARARALARLGRHPQAQASLATAIRACPRGAVDPLIVLEASRGLCLSLRGDAAGAAVHFGRSLAGARAIGHRYHEWWIDGLRAGVDRARRGRAAPARRPVETVDAALLLSDVATVLGAGHSIDLLAHRTAAILQTTTLAGRVRVATESGHDYQPEPSASCDTAADGTVTIRLRGSDRLATITVAGVHAIEEISLLKGTSDLVKAAVHRTADTEREDDDPTLWPRALVHGGEDTVFASPRMMELLKITARLAATDVPVLLAGETGTGKEIFARLIHEHSRVRGGPFVPFNCAAVPRDLVESQLFGHRRGAFTGAVDASTGVIRAAAGGTLFLDEVGDLDPAVQPKLLRFLESAEVHPVGDATPLHVEVRVVAATNADLDALAAAGRFRRDLYYRLGVACINVPPLRERKDEIPALASLFLRRYARECRRQGLRLADDFIAALLLCDWPGNLRQLANEVRRVVALAADGQTLRAADLAPAITTAWNERPAAAAPGPARPTVAIGLDQPLALAVEELERRFIEHAVASAGGRMADAARLLGLSRKGLFLKRRRRGVA